VVDKRIPRAPSTLEERGKRLWKGILTEYKDRGYVPEVADLELIERACVLADIADRLEAEIRSNPLMTDTRANGIVVSRAVEQHRQSVAQIQRLLKQLALPDDEDEDVAYDASAKSRRGLHAASQRWKVG